MSKPKKKGGAGKTVLQTIFGLLTGFVWILTILMVCYAIIVGILPLILAGIVGSLPVNFDDMLNTIVFGGGITMCIAGLVVILLWKFMVWSLTIAKKFYKSLCRQWNVSDDAEGDVAVKQEKQPISKKYTAIILIAATVLIVLLVWGVPRLMENRDNNISDSDITVEDIVGNTEAEDVEQKPLVAVDEAGLLDDVFAINFDEWTVAELNPVLDDMEDIVKQVQDASSYSMSTQIGFDVNGDMASYGEELLTYVGIDITASDVVSLVSDLNKSNGVFYDIAFSRSESDADVYWCEADGIRETDVIFDGDKLYVSGVNDIVEGSEGYAYVAQEVPDGADTEVMTLYEMPAELMYSLMQPALVNYSVDTDNVLAYTKETEYGTSYLYHMTEALSRGEFEYVTKTVMLNCVGDGEYAMTVVYMLEDDSGSGLLVVSIDADVTDIVVTVPDSEQVYFAK